MGVNSGHPLHAFIASDHATMGSRRNSKRKSGMNGHPRRPLYTRICGGEFWAFQQCFYASKPTSYGLQRPLMSAKMCPRTNFWGDLFFLFGGWVGIMFPHPRAPRDPQMFLHSFILLSIPWGPMGSLRYLGGHRG